MSVPRGRPEREQLLTDTFVALADTLVEDYDVVELLDRLVHAAVELTGVTAAGLLLDDQRGALALAATSSDEIRMLELFQLQSNEGPCLDCIASGTPVICGDLSAETGRWPRFVAAASAAGFRSVAAVPLRLREQTIGGLNLFDERGREISAADWALGQALAHIATIGILQRRSRHRSAQLAEQLQYALNSRVTIEQAKGILSERHQLTMEGAYSALRRLARDRNLKLADAAALVISGELEGAPAPQH